MRAAVAASQHFEWRLTGWMGRAAGEWGAGLLVSASDCSRCRQSNRRVLAACLLLWRAGRAVGWMGKFEEREAEDETKAAVLAMVDIISEAY